MSLISTPQLQGELPISMTGLKDAGVGGRESEKGDELRDLGLSAICGLLIGETCCRGWT